MKENAARGSRVPVYLAGLLIALGLTFYFFLMPLLTKKGLFRARVADLGRDISSEQALHQKLQKERRMLEENDPTYLEKYARDNFGWAREGEIVYKLDKSK